MNNKIKNHPEKQKQYLNAWLSVVKTKIIKQK